MKIPKHRCKIPGYTNDTYDIQSEFHALLVSQTIPITSKGDHSKCTVNEADDNKTISNNQSTRACSEWVYERSEFFSTFVTQFNLVCDYQIYRSHSNMAISAGKVIGSLVTSLLGDYFGRRRVYMMMMLILTGSAIGLAVLSNLFMLIVLRFLNGASVTGAYVCALVIGLELVGQKERRWIVTATSVTATLGCLVAVTIAYLTRNGQYFQAALAVPCLPAVIGCLFIPESPRWLMSKGRHKEAQQTIDVIARVNGFTAPLPSLTINNSHLEAEKKKTVGPVQLFRIPRLFVRYSLLYLIWMFSSMCSVGLMLNVSNMSGNVFLNYTILCLMDLVSLAPFGWLIDRLGRRSLLMVTSGVGGLACLATFLPVVLEGNNWIFRGLSFCGRLCWSLASILIYVFTPELFPTVLRSFGLGSCSMIGHVGSLASSYVADLNILVHGVWGPALPQFVFGTAGILTAVMTLVLPETKGQSLPETVREAAEFSEA
ncbi:organic cation transporter protein-like [Pomacea canaliculata]|uniref:organic cation transporter protein-like n=1 Tax=Pomacea canaliculata TaxID=400727 RepID=UPI000D7346CF|nr:organic cation transporter protein-like [Pomacea canaliculata]